MKLSKVVSRYLSHIEAYHGEYDCGAFRSGGKIYECQWRPGGPYFEPGQHIDIVPVDEYTSGQVEEAWNPVAAAAGSFATSRGANLIEDVAKGILKSRIENAISDAIEEDD